MSDPTSPPGTSALTVLGSDLTVTLADGTISDHINLDYAATAPCLAVAADAVNEALPWYASVHRGAGAASQRSTLAYERARQTIGDFVGARPDDYVVFTRNTTDALNLLARSLPANTTVVGWAGEHHANLLPWGSSAVSLPVPRSAGEAVDGLDAALAGLHGPVLVTVTGASNVTGEVWPLDLLTEVAHRHGARIAVDAAQLAPHRPVSLSESDVDYLAFSGHKLYAPFGAGVLAGRADWLDGAEPYLVGGGATAFVAAHASNGQVSYAVDWNSGPARHEAGTPNLVGAVSIAAVCDALSTADRPALAAAEEKLVQRLRDGLEALPGVGELRTFPAGHDRVGIVSFAVAGVAASDVSAHLATHHGIGVRDGLFCAHPLSRRLLEDASARVGADLGLSAVRASVGLGSTEEHVDRLLLGISELTR
nr:aminotransferase class V-fold PLP-dependent enzyme [Cryptosporangium phraense]